MQAQVVMPKTNARQEKPSNLRGVSFAPKTEEDSFVPMLQVDIKSGCILVDNREKMYWTIQG